MDRTTTYTLAETARVKLCREASRPDYSLRLLVGHANMLDSLISKLDYIELVQGSSFDQSLPIDIKEAEKTRHKMEHPQGEWGPMGSHIWDKNSLRQKTHPHQIESTVMEIDVDRDEDEDDLLILPRKVSKHSPPQLIMAQPEHTSLFSLGYPANKLVAG